ncbi:MAG: phosphonatase-like hydrolase [Betaproteobacteria bacterium]
MRKKISLAVLDMAGTTVQDRGEVEKAFSMALAQFGIPATTEAINAVRGVAKQEAIATLIKPYESLNESRVALIFEMFKSNLMEVFVREAQPIDGAYDTLCWLKKQGIHAVLNTGFDRHLSHQLLHTLGWMDLIDGVVCSEDVPLGRPAPYMIFRAMELSQSLNMQEVMNVGDTVSDLQAAHNAGVGLSVGVLTGAHSKEKLLLQPHTILLSSVAEIPALLA